VIRNKKGGLGGGGRFGMRGGGGTGHGRAEYLLQGRASAFREQDATTSDNGEGRGEHGDRRNKSPV